MNEKFEPIKLSSFLIFIFLNAKILYKLFTRLDVNIKYHKIIKLFFSCLKKTIPYVRI